VVDQAVAMLERGSRLANKHGSQQHALYMSVTAALARSMLAMSLCCRLASAGTGLGRARWGHRPCFDSMHLAAQHARERNAAAAPRGKKKPRRP